MSCTITRCLPTAHRYFITDTPALGEKNLCGVLARKAGVYFLVHNEIYRRNSLPIHFTRTSFTPICGHEYILLSLNHLNKDHRDNFSGCHASEKKIHSIAMYLLWPSKWPASTIVWTDIYWKPDVLYLPGRKCQGIYSSWHSFRGGWSWLTGINRCPWVWWICAGDNPVNIT